MSREAMSEGFAGFRTSILQHFGFLLQDDGFEIVYEKESDDAHGLLILGSDDFRLRFIHDRGSIEADVGAADAPTVWSREHEGEQVWFDLYTVAEFLEGRRPTLEEIRAHGHALLSMSIDERATDLANTLRRVEQETRQLFRKGASEEHRRAFLAYYSE